VDQACGVVARYRDENDYYLTRANALEDNVRFYYVKAGERHQLASYKGKVASKKWHTLRLDLRGDLARVDWDGAKVLEHRDSTFGEAGRVGLWTKADSVTQFDDLDVKPL